MKNQTKLFIVFPISIILLAIVVNACKDDDEDSPEPAKLPVVTTMNISEITAQDAMGGGEITSDGGGQITAHGLVWSTAADPTTANNEGISNSGDGSGSFTSELSSLIAYTNYYVRAYATNNAGTAYGNQVEFKTLPEGAYGTVTDIDGNEYYTTAIDNMEWMAQNLRVTRYADGTPIATGLSAAEWATTDEPAFVEYPFEDSLTVKSIEPVWELDIYGFYYNAYTVMLGLNPCPDGWRVATFNDWEDMSSFMGLFYDLDDSEVGDAFKSCRQVNSPLGGDCETDDHPRWNEHSEHYGTNMAFFLALPAGFINLDLELEGIGENIFWWEPADPQYSQNPVRLLSYDEGNLRRWYRGNNSGLSLRCLRPLKKK
jgi:uncharacterized protein (TIGR02145 family)